MPRKGGAQLQKFPVEKLIKLGPCNCQMKFVLRQSSSSFGRLVKVAFIQRPLVSGSVAQDLGELVLEEGPHVVPEEPVKSFNFESIDSHFT